MTKKIILSILITFTLCALCFGYIATNNLYPMYSVVTEINDDTVTITTNTGYMYSFVGAEDWEINDICTCIMYDNNTYDITDDIIIKTRYNGNVGH